MGAKFRKFVWLTALFVAMGGASSARAQAGGCSQNRGGNGSMSPSGRMMAGSLLAASRQQLSEAENAISGAESLISASNQRIAGARQAIGDAGTNRKESIQSRKSIETDILAAQDESSPYVQANSAFAAAQYELKTAREIALGGDDYLARCSAAKKMADSGAQLAKLQRDTLADDVAYRNAVDNLKQTQLATNRIKLDLFRASEEWVAAASAIKTASAEESKANNEARRAAMQRLPARQNLREAQFVANFARANIAQSEFTLRGFAGPGLPGPSGMRSMSRPPMSPPPSIGDK